MVGKPNSLAEDCQQKWILYVIGQFDLSFCMPLHFEEKVSTWTNLIIFHQYSLFNESKSVFKNFKKAVKGLLVSPIVIIYFSCDMVSVLKSQKIFNFQISKLNIDVYSRPESKFRFVISRTLFTITSHPNKYHVKTSQHSISNSEWKNLNILIINIYQNRNRKGDPVKHVLKQMHYAVHCSPYYYCFNMK